MQRAVGHDRASLFAEGRVNEMALGTFSILLLHLRDMHLKPD